MTEGSNRRVVVLFPGALGDLVLATTALAALRSSHAGAHVTLAVAGALRRLAATSGLADATASLDDADAVGLFGGTRRPSWFAERPDVYAWLGTRDPAVRDRVRSLAGRAEFFPVVRDDGPEHASSVYLRQVGAREDRRPFRWPAPAATPAVDAILGTRSVLAVHAGAGARAKRWPASEFAELVRRWRDAGGDAIQIVGPADHDVADLGASRRVVEWELPEVAALLARVDAFVGNDSGVSHLAGALGTPGIAVFGPTVPRRWAPSGAIEALRSDGPFIDARGGVTLGAAHAWSALTRAGCLDKLPSRE